MKDATAVMAEWLRRWTQKIHTEYLALLQLNNKKTSNTIMKKKAKDLNQHVTKEDVSIYRWQISTWKRCSMSVVINEMQIKTTSCLLK